MRRYFVFRIGTGVESLVAEIDIIDETEEGPTSGGRGKAFISNANFLSGVCGYGGMLPPDPNELTLESCRVLSKEA